MNGDGGVLVDGTIKAGTDCRGIVVSVDLTYVKEGKHKGMVW